MEIDKQKELKRIQFGSPFQGKEAEELRKSNREKNTKRHLITLVSTEGKTKEEIVDELTKALEKFKGVHNESLEKINKETEEEFQVVFIPTYKK
ncbi:MAG: hypothetical protein WC897_05880 [Candidatus Gracilibacteria bacterium]